MDYKKEEQIIELFDTDVDVPETVFTIDSDSMADWALKKIADEKAEFERIDAIAAEQIAELTAKREDLKRKYENKTGFLKGRLAAYFETVPHKETKTQETYNLLSGKLVKKKASVKLKADNDKLLAYMRINGLGAFIKTEEKPAWGDYKKRLDTVDGMVVDTETGIVVDGVVAEEIPAEFTVKL